MKVMAGGLIVAALSGPALISQEPRPLRVLTFLDEKRPDFFSIAPGREPGFDHEILQGFARLHGLKLRIVSVRSWDDLVPALLRGDGDVIAGRFTDTEERRRSIAFTVPVFPTRFAVMTRKPNVAVTTVEALRLLKVGTVKGTPMERLVRELAVPSQNVVLLPVAGDFGGGLRAGRFQAVVWGIESILAARLEDPAIELGMFVGPGENKAYGVRPADKELLAQLDEYIENFRRSISWNRLVVKYFGSAAPEILRKARE